jgi:hypothetical protein
MKTINLFILVAIAGALAVAGQAQAKESEEETISRADVPVAVQQAAEKAANEGRIIRWEKQGKRYEAVVKKEGKKWGIVLSADGKVLNRHDESKEKGHHN